MNIFEKFFSVFAIIFSITLITTLLTRPELRELNYLVPLCSVGFLFNVGLMSIVLLDIFRRPFSNVNTKYLWLALVLFIWPSIIYYVPKYGFKPRFT